MISNTKPFWESNLNPITMFSVTTKTSRGKSGSSKDKRNYVKLEELGDYISGSSLRKEYNIGSIKLKFLFESLGESPKYNQSSPYYSIVQVEKARELLSVNKEINSSIDTTNFICNKDLMEMFGFNAFKTWQITKNSKLSRTRFSGNINYYNREKAIAVFTQHIQ